MYEIYEYMPLLFNNIVKIRSCILFVTEGTFYYFNTMLAIFWIDLEVQKVRETRRALQFLN